MKRSLAAVASALLLAACAASPPSLRSILVVTPDPAHAKAFREFFAAQGISCESVGYAAVTSELADAHDLVIADAPEPRDALLAGPDLQLLGSFPRTKRPLLGISYWGTRALIRQGTALGRGYT